jgi:GAF domain-containing protein
MSLDRVGLVLAAMADVDGDAPSVVDRVCAAGIGLLGLSGCAISLMVDGRLEGSAGVSDAGIAVVQELQLELGEGPCVDAWDRDEPVGAADLADPTGTRWPLFSRAAVGEGVRAVFAFPLHQGAIRIGVLVLYRAEPGALSAEEWARGAVLADLAGQIVLALQAGARDGEVHELLADEPPHWAEVHQATGMISVQLGVPIDEAFVRMRAHAFAQRRPLREVARDVVARRLRLEASS